MKSAFHLLFLAPGQKADVARPGTSHADELMYLFDVELPIVLCDIGELQVDLQQCLVNPLSCILETGAFR
jgi:hypothetical protein